MPRPPLPDLIAAGEARLKRLEARAAAGAGGGPPPPPPPAALADAAQIARGFVAAIRGGADIPGVTLASAET